MVLFATAPTSPQGFFIGIGQSMGWRNLPQDLADEIEDARNKGESVMKISVGADGDWFLRTDRRHSCKTVHDSPNMQSNVNLFIALAEESGLDISQYSIDSFAFVPNPAGYICMLQRKDGLTRCAWRDVPTSLDNHLDEIAPRGIKCVAVGQGGSWVTIQSDGTLNWRDVPQNLANILHNSSGRAIESVALSLTARDHFFVQYSDGDSDYNLPSNWHSIVDSYRALTPKSAISPYSAQYFGTSYNSPNSSYASAGYSYPAYSPSAVSSSGYQSSLYTTYGFQSPTSTSTYASGGYQGPHASGGGHPDFKTDVKIFGGVLKVANDVLGQQNGGSGGLGAMGTTGGLGGMGGIFPGGGFIPGVI